MSLIERIHSHCIEDGDCLIWQGRAVGGTTPQMRVDGKARSVRRVLWEAEHGPVPKGKQVARTCECPLCIAHTALESYSQVAKRSAKTGVFALITRRAKISATKRAASGVTEDHVRDIREGGGSCREAAKRNGVSLAFAAMVRRGTRRADYSSPFAGLGLVETHRRVTI